MTTTRQQRPITGDAEVLSVLVALSALDSRADIFRQQVMARREFDVEKMLKHGWSTGERLLIQLAGALWKGAGQVDIGRLATSLSDDFFQTAMDAIAVRRKSDVTTFGADAVDSVLGAE